MVHSQKIRGPVTIMDFCQEENTCEKVEWGHRSPCWRHRTFYSHGMTRAPEMRNFSLTHVPLRELAFLYTRFCSYFVLPHFFILLLCTYHILINIHAYVFLLTFLLLPQPFLQNGNHIWPLSASEPYTHIITFESMWVEFIYENSLILNLRLE